MTKHLNLLFLVLLFCVLHYELIVSRKLNRLLSRQFRVQAMTGWLTGSRRQETEKRLGGLPHPRALLISLTSGFGVVLAHKSFTIWNTKVAHTARPLNDFCNEEASA